MGRKRTGRKFPELLGVTVSSEDRLAIEAFALTKDISMSKLLRTAIIEYMETHKETE